MSETVMGRFHSATVQRLREEFDRTRWFGLLCVLVGASQLPMAFDSPPDVYAPTFVVGGGAWLLIGIGMNLLMGRDADASGWNRTGELGWVAILVLTGMTVAIVAASVAFVLP